MLTSLPTQNNTCELCHKTLSSKYTLQRHIQLSHSTHKPFPCSYCSKSFNVKQYRDEHECRHTGRCPFACGFSGCTQSFSSRGKLCIHRKTHKGYVTKKYRSKLEIATGVSDNTNKGRCFVRTSLKLKNGG